MSDVPPPKSIRTVRDALEIKAAERKDEGFLQYQERAVSIGELNRKANMVANGFLDQGIEPGDHVGLFMYNSPEYLFAFFGLAKIGAVATPIDTRFTGDTLAYLLSESDIEILLLDSTTQSHYEDIQSQVPELTREYLLGDSADSHHYWDFHDLMEDSNSAPPETSVHAADTVSLTYIQQHPTNQPKGVLMPHFSYVNTGWEAGNNLFGYSDDDRIFTTLPLYSIYTFQFGVMGTLLSNAEFVFEDRFEPNLFWDQIETYDATVFLYLSRMLSVLYNQDIEPTGGTTPVELAVGASPGFASDEELFRNFEERFDLTIMEGYGTTQVSALATYNRRGDRNLDNVGKTPSYLELKIVDENDWPVPTGERGEIVVRPTRPNTMMKGYYGNPEQTIEDCRNQWIHTGGIGYRDEDGYVYFVATKENSLYRGRIAGRISSLEIESVIDTLPAVDHSTVIGVMNEDGSEDIKAVVVPADDVDISPVEICRHCEKQLPYLKVPRYIEIRDDLPRNPSGKIRKQDLQSEEMNGAWDRESGYELSR